MAAAQAGPSTSTQPSRKSTRPASNAAHAAPGKKAKKGKMGPKNKPKLTRTGENRPKMEKVAP